MARTTAAPAGRAAGPTRSATPGRARSSAPSVWRQNRAGSLSPASSDSHATGRSRHRAQSASRTVLPYPAGAQTSASPGSSPSSSRSASRGRGTKPGREPGTCSLVASRTSRSDATSDAAAEGDSATVDLHAHRLQRSSVPLLETSIVVAGYRRRRSGPRRQDGAHGCCHCRPVHHRYRRRHEQGPGVSGSRSPPHQLFPCRPAPPASSHDEPAVATIGRVTHRASHPV